MIIILLIVFSNLLNIFILKLFLLKNLPNGSINRSNLSQVYASIWQIRDLFYMILSGEVVGGNIIKPMHQILVIQENNSLGFNMTIPQEGIEVYGNNGMLYNALSMSNKGLIGSGTLKHLTSTSVSEEFKFFPDSMITQASTFNIEKDGSGIFPVLNSKDVAIKWLIPNNEWTATIGTGKTFDMFGNGTTLEGKITMLPAK